MTIAIEQFGRDHWSTLAYLETRVVDAGGEPDPLRMRCDVRRHPQFNRLPLGLLAPNERDGVKYPTRLRGGVLLDDHDDWDCLDDMEAAGLLIDIGTGAIPVVEFTDLGWRVAAALRKHMGAHKTTGNAYDTFVYEPSQAEVA